MNTKWTARIATGLVVTAALGALAVMAPAQGPQAPPISVIKLDDNVYVTQGGAGSNVGIIVGKSNIFVVDTKISLESGKQALDEIAKISPLPVNAALITHSDADHVNGLAAFPKGIEVIAQENCKKEMQATLNTPRPAPADWIPNHTVNMSEKMTLDGVKLDLRHWAPAHTSGDLVVYLPEQKIAFVGDLINPTTEFTGIHPEKNGSIAGWFTNVQGILDLRPAIIVPGHGVPQTYTQVQDRYNRMQARVNEIKAMIAQGKSQADIKMAMHDPAPRPGPNGAPPAATFTDLVYMEYSKKS